MNLFKLFSNPLPSKTTDKILQNAYSLQFKHLKQIWNEETYGIDRIVRLFLCSVQFVFPILFIRNVFGKWGALGRRLAVESYILLKSVFPLIVILTGLYRNGFVIFLIIYFLIETFVHILHLIFLSDLHLSKSSYRRSILLIFFHYAEVTFDFAALYLAFDILNINVNPLSAVYFSVVAATTVGFGDICVKNGLGQVIVISQLMVFVVFVVVFINYFSQKINE